MSSAAARSALRSPLAQVEDDVRAGLAGPDRKWLPSRLLYDDLGSALFDAICLLPEYGLTRADERILERHAADIAGLLPAPVTIAELGSGSGRKTRWMLEALAARQPVTYAPIDISRAALSRCVRDLDRLAGVMVKPVEADYLAGLAEVTASRSEGQPLLLLFLGSTIGNFERDAAVDFLRDVRRLLQPGDALLLGTDLMKPVARLLAAYDDPLGVTAAFDLNVLARINRELMADFDLSRFEHQARWNAGARRIEMHLVSRRTHAVTIRRLGIRVPFFARETIWTESSHKYTPEESRDIARRTGFEFVGQWLDEEWPFAESLLVAR